MMMAIGGLRADTGVRSQVRRHHSPGRQSTGLLKGCVVETEVGPGGAARTGATHSVTWKSRE